MQTRLPIKLAKKTGRRPYACETGLQNRGAPPRIAITNDVRYVVRWILTPRSAAISTKADWMADAVNVAIIA